MSAVRAVDLDCHGWYERAGFTGTRLAASAGKSLLEELADIAIREATGNRQGLQQGLRGVLAAGGSIEQGWPVQRVLSVADASTGTSVLTALYAQMKGTPVAVDLPALWARLGVGPRDGSVTLDDTAPLAAVRRAITAV